MMWPNSDKSQLKKGRVYVWLTFEGNTVHHGGKYMVARSDWILSKEVEWTKSGTELLNIKAYSQWLNSSNKALPTKGSTTFQKSTINLGQVMETYETIEGMFHIQTIIASDQWPVPKAQCLLYLRQSKSSSAQTTCPVSTSELLR